MGSRPDSSLIQDVIEAEGIERWWVWLLVGQEMLFSMDLG